MPDRRFLDKVYQTSTPEALRALYDEWAASYDDEVSAEGYATPVRAAAMLARHLRDKAAPILDFGCGTGLSGRALRAAGFTTIDGVDLSPGMLGRAEATSAYRALAPIGPDDEVPRGYGAIAAVGVVSTGAAPPETLDRLLAALAPGGLLVISYNSHTLDDARYTGGLERLLEGSARLVESEEGEHLPGIGLRATVYALRRR